MTVADGRSIHESHPLDDRSMKNDYITELILSPTTQGTFSLEPGNIKLIPLASSKRSAADNQEIVGWVIIEGEITKVYLDLHKIVRFYGLDETRSECDLAELRLLSRLLSSLESFSSRIPDDSMLHAFSKRSTREKKECPTCQRFFSPVTPDQVCCTSACQKSFEYISQMRRLREGRV